MQAITLSSKNSAHQPERRFGFRRKRHFRFPPREGNRLVFLGDADAWFDTALQHIRAAQHYVVFETYLVESGEILRRFHETMREAAGRGVKIHFLIDDYGARGLDATTRRRMCEAGIEVRSYNPFRHWRWYANLRRDHRKLLVVDGELAFVTGAGLTDDFSRELSGADGWRDTALQVSGPVVADCFALFAETWRNCGGALRLPPPRPEVLADGVAARLLAAEPHHNEILRALLRRLYRARRRIWLATPYFVPTRKLRRALRRAARRGVEVRLLLPGDHNDHLWVSYAARGIYQRLLRDGVRIFEFQPAFIHAKLAIVDDWATTGSSNFDRWDQRWNLDANLAFEAGACLSAMEQWFEATLAQCQEIDLAHWQARPWHRRLRERLAHLLINLLERVGRNRAARRADRSD